MEDLGQAPYCGPTARNSSKALKGSSQDSDQWPWLDGEGMESGGADGMGSNSDWLTVATFLVPDFFVPFPLILGE